jgi:basic amino acid/polyamine antiporter, APA family
MADQVHIPQETPRPASKPSSGEGAHQFGLTAAMALIVGSIIGVGVFNLPTSLAVYGPITLISMALTTVGALALAMLFAALSRRLPADGGPYAYARAGFGNPLGFINAWSYWITAWAGNAAIAVGWVLYVEHCSSSTLATPGTASGSTGPRTSWPPAPCSSASPSTSPNEAV